MTDPTANDTARPECQELCECPDNYRKLCWAMHNPGVWPPTSERDAHLGAYAPAYVPPGPLPMCTVKTPHEYHETPLPQGGEMICNGKVANLRGPMSPECEHRLHSGCDETAVGGPRCACVCHDPAPAGLTAAQEIRLRLVEALLAGERTLVEPDEMVRDLAPLVAWVEVGDGMTREQLAAAMAERGVPDPAACPDPALHEEDWVKHKYGQVAEANSGAAKAEEWVAELKTELLEAHADLEASRAREQIAAERMAEVLGYLDRIMLGTGSAIAERVRAILAGDQGEEA